MGLWVFLAQGAEKAICHVWGLGLPRAERGEGCQSCVGFGSSSRKARRSLPLAWEALGFLRASREGRVRLGKIGLSLGDHDKVVAQVAHAEHPNNSLKPTPRSFTVLAEASTAPSLLAA